MKLRFGPTTSKETSSRKRSTYPCYQSNGKIKHWKDKYNRTILTGGLEVDENFTFTYAKDDYSSVTVSPAQSVSNYTYEQRVNEDKRRIKVLKRDYLPAFITDMRNMMRYGRSSQYIDRTLKVSYNPKENGV